MMSDDQVKYDLARLTSTNLIWTDHALERARKRHISETAILAVLRQPARIHSGKKGTFKVIGTYQERRLHIIVAPGDRGNWVLVSVWVRGEEDEVFWLERVVGKIVEWVLRRLFPQR